MTAVYYQLKITFLRLIGRNKRFLLVSLLVPIFFYLLFTKVVSVGYTGEALQAWKADYLVSMVVYSLVMNAIMMVSSTLVGDRENGFEQFIALSPLPKWRYYASMMVTFASLFELSIASLLVAGYLANGVSFGGIELLAFFVVLPLASLPLISLGIMVSLTGSPNTVSGFANLVVFPMAIMSGLWWPIDSLPTWVQTIGKWLPPFLMSDLMKRIFQQHTFSYGDALSLFLWFGLLVTLLAGMLRFRQVKGYQMI